MVVVRRILRIVLGLVVCWLAGCGEQNPEQLFSAAEAAAADSSAQDLAIERFKTFLARYPQDERCDEARRKLAMIAHRQGDMKNAITHYERLLADYPTSKYGDEAQFMIAFIYEEYLQDLEQARKAYQRVIDHYPDSELAASARRLLPHVGRNPEEWVEFQNETDPP